MRLSVFTSCSVNYLPKARVLAKTLRRFHPTASITLLLNDWLPQWIDDLTIYFDRVVFPQDLGYTKAWEFKHNVMELCTAVKGRGLKLILEADEADLYAYLDPDVSVYNNLSPLIDYMGDAEIGLVPHITKPETTDLGVRLTELSVAAHGVYNLGHLIIRKGAESAKFATWWAERLDEYCYDDKEYGLFTDQRWCDLAPALFNKVRILKQPNIDVASWNAHGRVFQQHRPRDTSSITVDGHPLLTYHFSGTGPTGTHARVRQQLKPSSGVLAELELEYEEAIAAEGQLELENWQFSGGTFDNGTAITAEARKLYRKHADLQQAFPDPFASFGTRTYLDWLKTTRPSIAGGHQIARENILKALLDLFDERFYLGQYPEVRTEIESGKYADALDHYAAIGSRLLYDPNPYFCSAYYFERAAWHDPVRRQIGSARKLEDTLLYHYLDVGIANGLEPIPHFNSSWYLQQYPDVQHAISVGALTTALSHFYRSGDSESRDPSPTFNSKRYLASTPQVAALISSGRAGGAFAAFLILSGTAGRGK